MKKIKGVVIHGNALGRTIGFPTANIAYSENDIEESVFHLNIVLWKKIHQGMGTYMPQKKVFEAHIFDFDADIYGQEIEVILLQKIRDNQKFASLEDLKAQIKKDQKEILSHTLNVLSFGSFDVVHPWHFYYLFEARKYGTHLITIIATDANIAKIKWKPPKNPLLHRVEDVMKLEICDEVVAWSESAPLSWIAQYTPHSICLGYDQRGPFVDRLPLEIKNMWLESELIRIPSLQPEIYKSSLLKKTLI